MSDSMNCEALASAYQAVVVNGEEYWVVQTMPENRALCIRCGDALGGASAVPVYLLELPT